MKLRRKLLSAGFALGASALTLTTSTFAWYTANREVTTGTVSGATTSTVDSSSLYISAAQTYATTSQGATAQNFTAYTTTANPVVNVSSSTELQPVYFDSENYKYKTMSVASDGTTVSYTETASDSAKDVVEYVLRFQVPNNTAANGTNVYASKFDLTNSVDASASQQLALFNNADYAAESSVNVGISQAGNYNVDLLHSLKLTIVAKPVTFDSAAEGDKFAVSSTSSEWQVKVIDLDAYAKTEKDVNVGTADAVEYYNKALGTNIDTPSTYLSNATCLYAVASANRSADNSSTSVLFNIPQNKSYMEVRFTFWLDGWDSFCYDTCRRQQFTAGINFSTDAAYSCLKSGTARTAKAADPADIYNA